MKNRGFMYFYMVLYEDWGFISDIGERIGHSPLRGRYHGGLASKNDNLPAENGVAIGLLKWKLWKKSGVK